MLFISIFFSTKGTKMQELILFAYFVGGHHIISRPFHIVSQRFRAALGHFHVILCHVASNGDTSHSNKICSFFCLLDEIYINLIDMCEFLIHMINIAFLQKK